LRINLRRTRLQQARQSSDPQFAKFVENARWEKAG
jgi:hypothetical protein